MGLSSLRYCVFLQSTYPTTTINQWGYFSSQSNKFPIYIHDDIVDQAKADSNLSNIKNYIRPLSQFHTDFPDDVLPT